MEIPISAKRYKTLYLSIDDTQLNIAVRRALQRIANASLILYENTVETWKHPVKFDVQFTGKPGNETLIIGTDDLIFKFVDEGTVEHRITASPGKKLRFGKHRPETIVDTLGSFPEDPYSEFKFASYTIHPGAEPRDFTDEILKAIELKLDDFVSEELEKIGVITL